MKLRGRDRSAGIVYALYFLMALAAAAAMKPGTPMHAAGVGLNLLSTAVYAVLVVLLVRLMLPVNRAVALCAGSAGFAGCIVQGHGIVSASSGAAHLALAIFGVFCILLGALIVASTIIPKILGAALILAGMGWLLFFAPSIAAPWMRYIEAVGGLAELALMLWLLIVGTRPIIVRH